MKIKNKFQINLLTLKKYKFIPLANIKGIFLPLSTIRFKFFIETFR